MSNFNLEIITPDRLIYSGEISSLMVQHPSGKEGYLAFHESVLKELAPGTIQFNTQIPPSEVEASDKANTPFSIRKADAPNTYLIEADGGFLVFEDNRAVIFIR